VDDGRAVGGGTSVRAAVTASKYIAGRCGTANSGDRHAGAERSDFVSAANRDHQSGQAAERCEAPTAYEKSCQLRNRSLRQSRCFGFYAARCRAKRFP
jgi:hypothetical protein